MIKFQNAVQNNITCAAHLCRHCCLDIILAKTPLPVAMPAGAAPLIIATTNTVPGHKKRPRDAKKICKSMNHTKIYKGSVRILRVCQLVLAHASE